MKFYLAICVAVAGAVLLAAPASAAIMLIDGPLGVGNGDFNYEGGAVGIPGTVTLVENIPRDRIIAQVGGSPGQGVDVDGWTILRVAYSGANNSFGFDGNFGFDDAAFEPANTGSGQAFQNGNENAIVDFIADTISFAGAAGDVFNLNYLLGSDSQGGTSIATLTLDAGLGSEQSITFSQQTRSGTTRDAAHTITEQYTSTGAYSTVDLTLRLGNVPGSTRVLVDDVRLSVVPEPSAIMMLTLMGSCGMAVVNMRRRLG